MRSAGRVNSSSLLAQAGSSYRYAEVDFEALLRSREGLAGALRVLPGLDWWAGEESDGRSAKNGDDPVECLPVSVHDWCHPLELAEPFVRALGPQDAAAVRWDLNEWPEVPEAGLESISQKYAYLTLSVNSRDLYQYEHSADHTVHVHVRGEQDLDRVHWLAAQAGGRFEGRTELAPL
ncbi:hypothetical protein ACH45E_31835 [Streptomyces sp. NPDC020299]|uniref:hypothetical protein n=1 Tax=Streptomyces sp. NPDC020299 TaxID=3365067 RepID=UPI0037B50EA9